MKVTLFLLLLSLAVVLSIPPPPRPPPHPEPLPAKPAEPAKPAKPSLPVKSVQSVKQTKPAAGPTGGGGPLPGNVKPATKAVDQSAMTGPWMAMLEQMMAAFKTQKTTGTQKKTAALKKVAPTKAAPMKVTPTAKSAATLTVSVGGKGGTRGHKQQFCFWEGKKYKAGTDIERGQSGTWCFVTYCDINAKIQYWDDFNCAPNSIKKSPKGKSGCNHGGKIFNAGQEISNHKVGARCYGTYCDWNSKLVNWEDWCQAPAQSVTSKPTTSTVSPDGCWHNGKLFPVTADVVKGVIGDQCFGYYCDGQNTFVHWEDHCAQTTLEPPTTVPSTQSAYQFPQYNQFYWKK